MPKKPAPLTGISRSRPAKREALPSPSSLAGTVHVKEHP
jgi:hypothetical protein